MRAGGTQRTPIGIVGFGDVRVVMPNQISEEEAVRAGVADRATLLAFLGRKPVGEIHRVELRLIGPDPRVGLRATIPDPGELAAIQARLERLDRASHHGPWTAATLRAIAEHPATRAVELAAALGRERLPFKLDVRKLKELGLTESLERGYRISPRGRAVLDAISGDERPPAPPRSRPSRSPRRAGR